MLTAWTFATEQEARDAIDAIDAARGPTEDVRLPDGTIETRPRKTWCVAPIPLRDATFAVPYKPRLDEVLGRVETVRGEDVVIPLANLTRAVTNEERESDDDRVETTRDPR